MEQKEIQNGQIVMSKTYIPEKFKFNRKEKINTIQYELFLEVYGKEKPTEQDYKELSSNVIREKLYKLFEQKHIEYVNIFVSPNGAIFFQETAYNVECDSMGEVFFKFKNQEKMGKHINKIINLVTDTILDNNKKDKFSIIANTYFFNAKMIFPPMPINPENEIWRQD